MPNRLCSEACSQHLVQLIDSLSRSLSCVRGLSTFQADREKQFQLSNTLEVGVVHLALAAL